MLTTAPGVIRRVDPNPHVAILPGLPPLLKGELAAAYGLTVLDPAYEDELTALRALRAAIGDQLGESLPDAQDLEGWLPGLQVGRAHV